MKQMSDWARAWIIIGTVLISGCTAPTTPRYEGRFGESVREAGRDQVLHGTAPGHEDPVMGLDGAAGRAVVERYQASFRTPPKSFEVLNIGGTATGAAAQ